MRCIHYFIFLFLFSFSAIIHADKEKLTQKKNQPTENVIADDPNFEFGLILDETISKSGSDFFELFYLHWGQPEVDENINIRIEEEPSFFRTNFVLIWLDDELIIREKIPPKYDAVEELVIHSIKQVNYRLLDKLFIKKQLNY